MGPLSGLSVVAHYVSPPYSYRIGPHSFVFFPEKNVVQLPFCVDSYDFTVKDLIELPVQCV